MKISKWLPVLCAFAAGVTCLTVRAGDNPAQAAARIALAKQLFELNANPAKAHAEAQTKTDQATASTSARPLDENPAQAAARIALAKQLFELNANPAKAHAEAQAKTDQAAATSARPLDENQLAAQRAAQMAALAAVLPARPPAEVPAKPAKQIPPPAPVAMPAVVVAPQPVPQPVPRPAVTPPPPVKPVEANYAGKDLGMKPIAAPALPITASKEERLQELLVKYKADQISPEEYHKQRAAILAEP